MKLFKVSELADFLSISAQAIYIAIKAGKLPNAFQETREDGKCFWMIPEDDVIEYQRNKYSRDHFYNSDKNEISANAAAEFLGLTTSSIYNLIRSGYLPYRKNGWHYILTIDDVMEMKRKRIATDLPAERKTSAAQSSVQTAP